MKELEFEKLFSKLSHIKALSSDSKFDDYSEQSTPLIPTQSTPVNFIKNFLDFPLDSY